MIANNAHLKIHIILRAIFGIWLAMCLSVMAQAGEEKSAAFTKAQSLMKDENYKSAAKIITKAQEQGEDTIEMSLLLTQTYAGRVDQVGALSKLGIAKKLKASMEHSLTLAPDNRGALIGIVEFHLQAPGIAGGSKKEARRYINKIIELYPVRGHLFMAQLELEEDNLVNMQSHLDKALAIDPENTDVLIGIGSFEVKRKNYGNAVLAFDKCLSIDNDNVNCRYQLGKSAQIGKVEYAKGKKAFLDIIASPPENIKYLAFSHYRLGNIYKQEGDTVSAKTHYQLAIDADDLKEAKKALSELNK